MSRYYDADAVRKMLTKKIAGRPLREVASEIGMSHSYLAQIASGDRDPSEAVLRYLGLGRRIIFVRE